VKSKWVLLLFVLLFATSPGTSLAEDAPQPADVEAASVDGPAMPANPAEPGCPGAPDGKCCGACQQRARLSKKPAAEVGGCPCQRARQASEPQSGKDDRATSP
jgi:hypothetical protein